MYFVESFIIFRISMIRNLPEKTPADVLYKQTCKKIQKVNKADEIPMKTQRSGQRRLYTSH